MSLGLLVVLTMVAWGVWGLLDKLAVTRAHPLVVQLYGALFSLLSIPVYLVIMKKAGVRPDFPAAAWHWIFLGTAVGVAGLVSFTYALRQAPASYVIAVTATYPAVTMILAAIFLGERVGLLQVLGIALISAGLYALNLAHR